jgi:hypothetical protein
MWWTPSRRAEHVAAASQAAGEKAQRPRFNLDLVMAGLGGPVRDLPVHPRCGGFGSADRCSGEGPGLLVRGIWASPDTVLAYEYRAMEKLFEITATIVSGGHVDG